MFSLERLRDIQALEFRLFGGLSPNEGYAIQRDRRVPAVEGEVVAVAEYDPVTRSFTTHEVNTKPKD